VCLPFDGWRRPGRGLSLVSLRKLLPPIYIPAASCLVRTLFSWGWRDPLSFVVHPRQVFFCVAFCVIFAWVFYLVSRSVRLNRNLECRRKRGDIPALTAHTDTSQCSDPTSYSTGPV
jgi:hypothetical protein